MDHKGKSCAKTPPTIQYVRRPECVDGILAVLLVFHCLDDVPPVNTQLKTQASDLTHHPPGQGLVVRQESVTANEGQEGQVRYFTLVTHEHPVHRRLHAFPQLKAPRAVAVAFDDHGAAHDDFEFERFDVGDAFVLSDALRDKPVLAAGLHEIGEEVGMADDIVDIDDRVHDADFLLMQPAQADHLIPVKAPEGVWRACPGHFSGWGPVLIRRWGRGVFDHDPVVLNPIGTSIIQGRHPILQVVQSVLSNVDGEGGARWAAEEGRGPGRCQVLPMDGGHGGCGRGWSNGGAVREGQGPVLDGGEVQCLLLEGVQGLKQGVDLLLEAGDIVSHVPELFRVLEIVGAAVWSILAGEVEVATALTRSFAIALDLAPLALVAAIG